MIFLITLLCVASSLLVAQEVGSDEKSKPTVPASVDVDKEPLASIIKYYATSQKPTTFKANPNPRIRGSSGPRIHKSLSGGLNTPIAASASSNFVGLAPLTNYVTPKYLIPKPFQSIGLTKYDKTGSSFQSTLNKPLGSSQKSKSSNVIGIGSTTPNPLLHPSTGYSFLLPILKYKSTDSPSGKVITSVTPKGLLTLSPFTAAPLNVGLPKGSKGYSASIYAPPIKKADSGAAHMFNPSYVVVSPIYKGYKHRKANLTSTELNSNLTKDDRSFRNSTLNKTDSKPESAESAIDSNVFINLPVIAFNVDSAESKEANKNNLGAYYSPRPFLSESKETNLENQGYVRWAFPTKFEVPSQLNTPEVSREIDENKSNDKDSSEVTGSQFQYSAKHSLPFRTNFIHPKPFELSILGMPNFGKYVEDAIKTAKGTIINDKNAEIPDRDSSAAVENDSRNNEKKEVAENTKDFSKNKTSNLKKQSSHPEKEKYYYYDGSFYHFIPKPKPSNKKFKWVNGKIVPKCRKLPHSPYPNVVIKNIPHNIAHDHHNSDESHNYHVYNKKRTSSENGNLKSSLSSEDSSKAKDAVKAVSKSEEINKEDSKEIIEKLRKDLQGEKKPILEDAEVLFSGDLKPTNKSGRNGKNISGVNKTIYPQRLVTIASSELKDKIAENRRKASVRGYQVREEPEENKSSQKDKESAESKKASSEKESSESKKNSSEKESSESKKANSENEDKGNKQRESTKDISKEAKKEEETATEAKTEEELKKEEEARIEEELRKEEEARREAQEAEEREKEIEREILEEFKSVFPDISSLGDFDDDEDYYGRPNRRDRNRDRDGSSSREAEESQEYKGSVREENNEEEDEDSSGVNIEQEIMEDLKDSDPIYADGGRFKKYNSRYGSSRHSRPKKKARRDSHEKDHDDYFKGWYAE